MKIKNYILALLCLFMFNYSFATDNTTLRERTENWLKKAPAATTDESATGRIGDEQPTDDPGVPLEGSLLPVLLLSGVYIALLSRKHILDTRSIRIKN
jgi:hypothetical protein